MAKKEWKKLKNRSKIKDKNTAIEIDTDEFELDDSDKNLKKAEDKATNEGLNIDWFASYSIKKNGNDVKNVSGGYTIKFDKPTTGNKLYYYYEDSEGSHLDYVNFFDDEPGRVKATLYVGDPPIGAG